MRGEADVAPLYLRKVRGREGLDSRYLGIGSIRVFSGSQCSQPSRTSLQWPLLGGGEALSEQAVLNDVLLIWHRNTSKVLDIRCVNLKGRADNYVCKTFSPEPPSAASRHLSKLSSLKGLLR
jgi:hypothetical protein